MEIGSIFEIEPTNLFINQKHDIPLLPVQKREGLYACYFNTGRTAIEMVLKKLKREGFVNLLIPSFVCDSVRDAALRAEMNLVYYRVNKDLSVDVSTIKMEKQSILYVVQFFGQRINQEFLSRISHLQHLGVVVIEDISLSLFSNDEKYVGFGDYIIGSLRKWIPIIDGGILLSKNQEQFDLINESNDYTLYYYTAQILKGVYLNSKKRNQNWKQTFLSYNSDGIKALFSDYTPRKISRVSLDLMRGVDFNRVIEKRNQNYDTLYSLLLAIPQIRILVQRKGTMTPLGMVILSEERDDLLQYLISKDIYCNVHWHSNESTKEFPESEYLAKRCITIPCDQRYGDDEMRYIYHSIRDFYGE